MKSLLSMLKDQPLSAALAQAESAVKASPADADKRAAWVQLLLLCGDWPRASAQLPAWQALAPLAKPTTLQLSDAVMAETQRERVFRAELAPAFLTTPNEWLSTLARALQAPPVQASTLRAQAFELAAASAGSLSMVGLEEQAHSAGFNWLADADSRLGPVCELLLDGGYYWVPFQDIASITFQAPQNAVHLIWAHASVKWRSGRQQVCQIPARYPLSASTSDSHRLGQLTDWQQLDDDGHYAGQGQKTWLTDNDEYPLLTLRQLQFTSDKP